MKISQLEKYIFRYVREHNQSGSHLEVAEEQKHKMKLQSVETVGQLTAKESSGFTTAASSCR